MKLNKSNFCDDRGRVLSLRGVNLGGSSKMPYNTSSREPKFNETVSFVNRPFPLSEADEHFNRLKTFGFNTLRFLVTWEAIEPNPGAYDYEYLDYLKKIVDKANEYGFYIFIDPHQDVWGRPSGGDGAPLWTYEIVGFNINNFKETNAATLHSHYELDFPKMIWPTNYSKLATMTMFTLFFGGDDFAPKCTIGGVNIKEYLQSHYINAIGKVAEKLKDCKNVIGFDTLNEPTSGMIGKNLSKAHEALVFKGLTPTPLQAFTLGDGYSQEVEIINRTALGLKYEGTKLVNKEKVRAWKDDTECIWKVHGVWTDKDEIKLINEEYFMKVDGVEVNFGEDYLKPFIRKLSDKLHSINKEWFIFYEPNVDSEHPKWIDNKPNNMVYTPHWYDAMTLFLKKHYSFVTFNRRTKKLVLGKKKVKEHFISEHKLIIEKRDKLYGEIPMLIGEIGIPYDMHEKKAYKTNNYKRQIRAMDLNMSALEQNFQNFTLWNYTSDNNHLDGDLWNGEDLSIYSKVNDNKENIYSGGRALISLIRPYALAIAGIPKHMSFNIKSKEFIFEFESNSNEQTEIFVPYFQYRNKFKVINESGTYQYNQENQILYFTPNEGIKNHKIVIRRMR